MRRCKMMAILPLLVFVLGFSQEGFAKNVKTTLGSYTWTDSQLDVLAVGETLETAENSATFSRDRPIGNNVNWQTRAMKLLLSDQRFARYLWNPAAPVDEE